MDFFVGIFVLAYGVAGIWAVTAHDMDRRRQGLAPGEGPAPLRSASDSLNLPHRG